jgi:FAD binding domain/Berberine and berberine like
VTPGPELDRRTVLRLGAIGALGAMAGGGALGLTGCGSDRGRGAATTTEVATTTEPLDDAAWRQLAASLTGSLVRPGDASYLSDLQLYDPRYDSVRPAGIAYCASAADVQRCVAFASEHHLPIAARSGGHSYGGYSTSTGLVVDVTTMKTVSIDRGTATIGSGARLIDVYSGLNDRGVSIAAGSCGTVGIAGLTLGGGQGVVGRLHGLTCDQLTSVTLVTADGRLRTVSADQDPDLFWACQGGGGGNFGIATSFTFATFPVSDVATFVVRFPWAATGQVLPAWLAWAPHAPDELWANCVLLANADTHSSHPLLQVAGLYVGSPANASALVNQFVASTGTTPTSVSVNPTTLAHAMYIEAGCATLTEAQCHLPSQAPGGQLTRQASLAKSQYVTAPMSGSTVATLVTGVDERQGSPTGGGVAFDAYGGAINRVKAGDTAFVHRNTLACGQFSTNIQAGESASTTAASQAWLDQFTASVHAQLAPQAYQNYIDPSLADWPTEYYGSNLARLQKVKQAVDPDDFFRFAQSIPRP